MEFRSILFNSLEDEILEENCTMPEFFVDLNLDQVVHEILADKEEYNLQAFFYQSVKAISTINFRLEVMQELEQTDIYNCIAAFSNEMKKVREFIGFSRDLHNRYQREKWLLDAVTRYCNAILSLNKSLLSMELKSTGLRLFTAWLTKFINSGDFKTLLSDTENLLKEFDGIRYSVQVEKDKVVVNRDEDEEDYCAVINSTFERLNEVTFDYRINFFTGLEMCVLETRILEIVRKMNKEAFTRLGAYYEKHHHFLNETITRFDREIQFYISYIDYIGKLKRKGFNFTYPEVSHTKEINIVEGYDIALAYKLIDSRNSVVSNDFFLKNEERVFILTGPNQGGKTTFARAFGQIHFLASIGCPVPCRKARISFFDSIFTHFSTEENLSTNAGRLKEELSRLKQVIEQATTNSVIIINELFATTTSHDAYTMGKKVLDYFIALDCICLYVTHIYELVQISKKAVSLVAGVSSESEAARTYKIVRKPADGHAYANSIVEKYSLTYRQIKERIRK